MQTRLEQLQAFIAESPNDSFLKYALATEYLKLGEQEVALKGFQQLVQEDPTYVGTYYHLGKLLVSLSRVEEAIQVYKAGMVIAQNKRNMHAYGELKAALLLLTEEDDSDEDDY
ncbi:tetratricopeptide repeat protein [Sphingobacteriaceae bacterium WQ 2009]|uniref:Tetratricopeptide repeat protein n=1 Tax=Rhinopithecimicrobium faecis TaxID=2820698 RepID=A0A8T4H868_9SPHI|nr:tetratricopeptide repeat protein [Sphingobacteriaceae bacterium WQ 2009]